MSPVMLFSRSHFFPDFTCARSENLPLKGYLIRLSLSRLYGHNLHRDASKLGRLSPRRFLNPGTARPSNIWVVAFAKAEEAFSYHRGIRRFSMQATMKDSKIHSQSCELNVVYHCNLSCRACSHLSPQMKKSLVAPEEVYNDFSILAKYYRPEHVRLLGGEPLLHPALVEIVDAVRRSNISDRIRVITNGILLWKMPDLFWQGVDEIHISAYPGYEPSDEKEERYRRQAIEHNVDLKILYFDSFRESYSELGTTDRNLIKRLYSTCQIAHVWQCHNVSDGYFYKCPQSLCIPRALKDIPLAKTADDGIKITDSGTFLSELQRYLESKEPLHACQYCLGSAGKLFPHEQEPRHIARAARSTEELVDIEFLETLECDVDSYNSCWH
jgi:GTP 3',8-cyclase